MWWLAQGERDLPDGTSWLSGAEAAYADSMRFTKRRTEFLVARWTAKQVLCRVMALPASSDSLRRIEVRHAASGAPLAYVDGEPAGLKISLTDRAGWAVCLLSGQPGRLGCDLELVESRTDAFVRDYLTAAERRAVDFTADDDARNLAANLIWSATESALKVLETGLRRDTRSVEVTILPASQGWGAFSVRTAEGDVFPGRWHRFGEFVLTVAADAPFPPPDPLGDAALLAEAQPSHRWLAHPVVTQPERAIPRSSASMT